MNKRKLSIQERMIAPTPSFFKKLRNIGLIITAISATILTAPISLPLFITSAAGYLAVAGGVISAVSQITVDQE